MTVIRNTTYDSLTEYETTEFQAVGLTEISINLSHNSNPNALIHQQCELSINSRSIAIAIDKMDIANLIMLLAYTLNEME